MVFDLMTAIIVPTLGLAGLVAVLSATAIASHTIEMPWYLSNLAMYHVEFLAGVLAFITRPKLVRLGAVLPLAIGSAALWYFVVKKWGGRSYVAIALFFLIVGFANIKINLKAVTALGTPPIRSI